MAIEPSKVPFEIRVALVNLIFDYVQRQQLVVQAMVHFRPDLIRGLEIDKILGINLEEEYKFFLEHYLGNDAIFNGIWRDEWQYYLHGYGCKLTNLKTKEPLEWDAGHPQSFYLGWFATHLEWRIQQNFSNEYIKICYIWLQSNALQDALDKLIEDGVLQNQPEYSGWFLRKENLDNVTDA